MIKTNGMKGRTADQEKNFWQGARKVLYAGQLAKRRPRIGIFFHETS
jgi:hypothetical protein